MGVKTCNRRGCKNIMCDRYSSEYGYICDECFIALKNSKMDIHTFMHTPRHVTNPDYDYDKEFQED